MKDYKVEVYRDRCDFVELLFFETKEKAEEYIDWLVDFGPDNVAFAAAINTRTATGFCCFINDDLPVPVCYRDLVAKILAGETEEAEKTEKAKKAY